MVKRRKKWFFRLFITGITGVISITGIILFCNFRISSNAHGKHHRNLDELEKSKVAIVLGTSAKTRRGYKNEYFVNRIKAAAELYHSGKVEYLLVSGDNSRKNYDEPTDMKMALIGLGVPAEKIYMDYAGFRTWDSMVRCKAIFGQSNFIIVSQEFHNERAIYIAEYFGCKVQAYNAENARVGFSRKREYLARVKLFLDIMARKKPKFLGEKIVIGQKQRDVNA